ncbi:signal peptidase I [Methanoculleus chikugoensis]|uniref:signal peptidase I n=1 Tax=Methanoculleus chikugoensis TaxID=118126 RepID=UPI0006D20DE8|nr:signal peptidase I [Methanoculleus chikugoensis]
MLPPGDVIIVAPTDPDQVRVGGDVIVFQHPGQDDRMVITHRVTGIDADTGLYSTKGDANSAPDRFSVSKGDIIGRPIFLIPFIGFASEMKKQVILLMVILPSLMLALLETRKLTHGPPMPPAGSPGRVRCRKGKSSRSGTPGSSFSPRSFWPSSFY